VSQSGGNDAHHLTLLRTLGRKLYASVHFGEQRVVAAHADVFAGVHTRAALTDDDAAGGDQFATEAFNAESFGLRNATVEGTAASFFMCHEMCSP
jgi:hypothetical protein